MFVERSFISSRMKIPVKFLVNLLLKKIIIATKKLFLERCYFQL